jgi:hypothetical protein
MVPMTNKGVDMIDKELTHLIKISIQLSIVSWFSGDW